MRRALTGVLVCTALAGAATASARTVAPWVWTKKQAEYHVGGNGNRYIAAACRGLGAPYRQHGINYYYRFTCVVSYSGNETYVVTIKPVSATKYRILHVQKLRGATAGGVYPDTGSGHWIDATTDDGSVVTLEDGSRWLVSPVDRYNVLTWLPVDNVTVLDGDDPTYPYRLIDTDDGSAVNAKFLGY